MEGSWLTGAPGLPPPQPPPAACCVVSRPLRTTVTPAPPSHFKCPPLLVCYCKTHVRPSWTCQRPWEARHWPPSYLRPDIPRAKQRLGAGREAISFQGAGRSFCAWQRGEAAQNRGKGSEASHREHPYTGKLLVYLGFGHNWVSCTFSGQPYSRGQFRPRLCEMRESRNERRVARPLESPVK